MELLWGLQQPPKRGPKQRLTVEQISQAAIRVADAEGLAALSMRRVADALGVAPMSLYTYVPSKAELIDVMLDAVYGELPRPEKVAGGWRARLERIARENWALYHRHPWMLQIAMSRPVMGPHLIAKYDYELRAVSELGLTEVEMDSVVSLVNGHVEGAARRAVEATQAEQHTGMSDAQWWEAHAPLLEKVFDASRYPTAARVGAAAGAAHGSAYNPELAFEFGLQRVLDGIAVFIQARSEQLARK